MKTLIEKIKEKTFDEVFRERFIRLLRDIILLVLIIFIAIKSENFLNNKTIVLFEEPYRVDMLFFYVIGFILILTSSILFLDLRNILNVISRYVITRFPRMKGEFGPTQRIFRDVVHILIMILTFFPLSNLISRYSFEIFSIKIELLYIGSLFFLILTMLFVYDIIIQFLRIIGHHYKKLEKLLKLDQIKDNIIK